MLSESILCKKKKRKEKNLALKLLHAYGLFPVSVLNLVRLQPPGNQMKSGVFLPLVP